MSTSDDRPYDQESAHEESAAGRAGRRDADDTGVERHAPSSATELWDHNAYGREDGNIGGSATTGPTDTRDPRGGAPAYNIDAGDDDVVRHGDDSGRDDGSNVRETGEPLSGPDATAGSGRESIGDGGRDVRRSDRRAAPPAAAEQGVDRETTVRGVNGRDAPDATRPGAEERGAGRHVAGDGLPAGRGGTTDPGGDDLRGDGAVRGEHLGKDPAVVRHEERLRVGTERIETGRTRLRKYVVEEPVRVEQTLASEDVEEVRTPITEQEREAFLAGAELPVGEDEVILYREVPVVQTVRVPYERVRLAVRRAERTEVVEDTVRRERVDVEED